MNKIINYLNRFRFEISKRKHKKLALEFDTICQINENYRTINKVYDYFHHYFWNLSPDWLRTHRLYFKQDNRGFGEDAFHAMWYIIFKIYKPINILEIGVYRGQTLSLFSLLAKQNTYKINLHGISPFNSSGDQVSVYLKDLNYYNDVIRNFESFSLTMPNLHKGYSTDNEMIDIIDSQNWDLIYIDGNHDYEIAKFDFDNCTKMLKKGGILVLDDSSLNLDYKSYFYSSKGHPGPSKIADEISRNEFDEILVVGHNRVFQKK